MPVVPFKGKTPKISDSAWIAPDAWVIGDVTIGEKVSIFFGAVLRGDILPIHVGDGTNIQEGAMLHTSTGMTPCVVGNNVTVGHHAIIHGCTVEDCCIIGMGATILDGAVVKTNSLVGANALVKTRCIVDAGSLTFGTPAKIIRALDEKERHELLESALNYQKLGAAYRSLNLPIV